MEPEVEPGVYRLPQLKLSLCGGRGGKGPWSDLAIPVVASWNSVECGESLPGTATKAAMPHDASGRRNILGVVGLAM